MSFFKKNPQLPDFEGEGPQLKYNGDVRNILAYQMAGGYGPSAMMSMGNRAFGISSRVVLVTSVKKLPTDIGVLMVEGLEYEAFYDSNFVHNNFDLASMGWMEIGINYAQIISQWRMTEWAAGINIRRLMGFAGVSMYANSVDYTLINDTLIDIANLDAEFGFSIPINYDSTAYYDQGPTFKGKGIGVDLGFVFRKKKLLPNGSKPKRYCQDDFEDYHYKFGFSILDLGKITFKENAQAHIYENVSRNWYNVDTIDYISINSTLQNLSRVFYNDPDKSLVGREFGVNLQAALGLQLDYQYFQNWFVNANLLLPVTVGKSQIKRPAQAIISLRHETPRFEFSVPFSLYDFRKPRLGLFVRYYYFGAGTEKLGGFFGFNDFTGLDFYFSIKFHIMKGRCGRWKPQSDCGNYEFE